MRSCRQANLKSEAGNDPPVFSAEIHHAAGLGDYLRLAWLVTTLGTIGGALGAAVESDRAVREAAYGYRPEERQPTDRG